MKGAAALRVGLVSLVVVLASVAHARAPSGQYETFGPTDDTIRDARTKLIWQRMVTPQLTWEAASQFCSTIKLGGLVARLPSVKELLSIVDEDVNYVYVGTDVLESRAIDKFAFPDTPGTYFWTSTKAGGDALVIDFRDGKTQKLARDLKLAVRCVTN